MAREAGPGRILVVDDSEVNRLLLREMLEVEGYEVEVADGANEALEKVQLGVDLALIDAMMPEVDGFELARQIRDLPHGSDLPLVMVTALDSRRARLKAVEAGVNDFISKPVEMTELGLRVRSQLRLKAATDALKRHGEDLERVVDERTAELLRALVGTEKAYLDTLERLVLVAEYRDQDTASHILRVSELSGLLAQWSGAPPPEVELVRRATPMHDIGKIGIPDAVLLKPGALTEEERAIMQRHTLIGAEILQGTPSEILQAGAVVALTHHERWDGTGYPKGIRGEAIPRFGRICAIADVLDALTMERPYRPAYSLQEAREMMAAERGTQFDPELLDLFFGRFDEIAAVRQRLAPGA